MKLLYYVSHEDAAYICEITLAQWNTGNDRHRYFLFHTFGEGIYIYYITDGV